MLARRAPATTDLTALFAALLEALGADELLTTTEGAQAAGITPEAIRCWCRDGKVGFYDARLRQFLIPRRELRAFLEAHWHGRVPARFDEFEPAQTRSALSILAMTDEKKLPRLTPMEQQQLSALLSRVEGFRAGPVADAMREEQALKARQEKLAEQERKLTAKVAELRGALDEIAERLGALAVRRSPVYSTAPKLKPLIEKWVELEGPELRWMVEEGFISSAADIERELLKWLTVGLQIGFNLDTTAERFLHERPAASSLADYVEAHANANGAPPPKTDAEEQAEEVIATGKRWGSRLFRDDAPPPTNKRGRRQ
jgi:hypothetical protein